jgi:hypothetical protein
MDNRIFLLDDALLRPLQYARTRTVERRLHPLEDKVIEKITVRQGSNTRTFVQRNADDTAKAHYADAATPEQKDVEGTSWLGKLARIRLKEFIADDAAPQGLEPVFSYLVEGDGKQWPVEIVRTADGATWYARAGFTRGLVELTKSLIQEPADDLGALFDADHGKEDEAPAEPPADGPPGGPPGAPPGGPPGGPPPPGGGAPKPGGVNQRAVTPAPLPH